MSSLSVDTAVVPVAGLATRMQPLARSVPKELLPLGDRPVLHHVVEELAAAGVRHIVFVVSPRSKAIERYFGEIPELDRQLERAGKDRRADPMWAKVNGCSFSFLRQKQPQGVVDAVSRARRIVGNRRYFVHMGDSVIHEDSGLLGRMMAHHTAAHADATIAVAWRLLHPSSSRAIAVPSRRIEQSQAAFNVDRVLESPRPDTAHVPFAIGRYLLEGPMGSVYESGVGRFGGLTSLFRSGGEASVVAVPLLESEHLLGGGTIDEYQASWRHWLTEAGQ